MDLRRARVQDWLMGGLGALLAASLFLPWYRPCPPGDCEPVAAWTAFVVIDVVLLVAGLTAVVALVLTLVHRTPAVPLALTSIGTFLAVAAALCAVVSLAFPPALPAEGARLAGVWLGTGAAVGLLVAMLASIRDERTPVPPRSLDEQERAVRTLRLSTPAGGAEAARGPEAAG